MQCYSVLCNWQVVRRRKAASKSHASSQQRASFPMASPQVSESKAALKLEQRMHSSNIIGHNGISDCRDSSNERLGNDGKSLQPTRVTDSKSDVPRLTTKCRLLICDLFR
jgi:hypothetical protein